MKYLIVVILGLFSSLSFANVDFGITAGLRKADASAPVGYSVDQDSQVFYGVILNIPIGSYFALRQGIQYSERYFELKSSTDNFVAELQYLDIPIQFSLPLSESIGVYAGFIISKNISKDCNSVAATCSGVTDPILFSLGFGWKIVPSFGVDLSYEKGSDLSDEVMEYSAWVGSLTYWF